MGVIISAVEMQGPGATMNYSNLSEQLVQGLQLPTTPVALGFMDQAPEGVAVFDSTVPSACAFWTQAEKGLFFAKAEFHDNCPIGVMTMGFPVTPKVLSNLTDFVQKMCNVSYLGAKEPAHIPGINDAKSGILYGPLSLFPVPPGLVLFWVNGRQAMLLEEALGTVCWDAKGKAEAFGRPACGALAIAANESRSTLSLGCSGMRTFTEVPDDKMLASIPGSLLQNLEERLRRTVRSNEQMLAFYRQHKSQYKTA